MTIKITINQDNIITGYASVGDLNNSIEVTVDKIPSDLCDGYYRYVDGQIVLDEQLKEYILSQY